jgi:hypothetical protein
MVMERHIYNVRRNQCLVVEGAVFVVFVMVVMIPILIQKRAHRMEDCGVLTFLRAILTRVRVFVTDFLTRRTENATEQESAPILLALLIVLLMRIACFMIQGRVLIQTGIVLTTSFMGHGWRLDPLESIMIVSVI